MRQCIFILLLGFSEGVGGAGDRKMAFKLVCSVQKTLAVIKKQTEKLVLWCDTLSNTKGEWVAEKGQ